MGVTNSSVAWGDFDKDRDLDILMTISHTRIYRNNGNNTFSDQASLSHGLNQGSSALSDYDNDGDLDILLTGNGIQVYSVTMVMVHLTTNRYFFNINGGLLQFSSLGRL